jgi:hypothetical protein
MDGAMSVILGKLEAGDWKQAEMDLQAVHKNE